MARYGAKHLVSLDESALDLRMTWRTRGWGQRGQRVVQKANFVRGQRWVDCAAAAGWLYHNSVISRWSILPALTVDGVLDVTVVKGSVTGDRYLQFVERVLDQMNPYPNPYSVLLMDNASIHKSDELEQLVTSRWALYFSHNILFVSPDNSSGMRLVYLPAYSPDFNPIEEGFSATKAWIRRHGKYVRSVLSSKRSLRIRQVVKQAVYTAMTAQKAAGWFEHSGYV